ncbi:MAG: Inward rectifier potassium channel Irk [Chitinophagaceae bacterium]|nr:MAG: Inward rectifier potassium channel Irk [Chitinophagaceae bacterium]
MNLRQRLQNFRNISENNTGFGTNSANSGERFYNRRTGSANVVKRGVGPLERYSWYHTMLAMPSGKFILLLFIIYICINLVFASVYYLIGINHLAGIHEGSAVKNFTEVFFFSTQTFTTVGYGRISPAGFAASSVATFEAFLGLLSFAIATGLFYGRFSRPQAFLRYSDNAIIAPYKDGIALMFRMSPYKNNNLSEAETKVTVAMQVEENGKMTNQFFSLDLEISKVNALALSWTIVHAINEKSPLYNFSYEDMVAARCEVFVFVKAFDEVFSNTVMSRNSYIASEIVWGAKFQIMYHISEDKRSTVLELEQLNTFDRVELPQPVAVN